MTDKSTVYDRCVRSMFGSHPEFDYKDPTAYLYALVLLFGTACMLILATIVTRVVLRVLTRGRSEKVIRCIANRCCCCFRFRPRLRLHARPRDQARPEPENQEEREEREATVDQDKRKALAEKRFQALLRVTKVDKVVTSALKQMFSSRETPQSTITSAITSGLAYGRSEHTYDEVSQFVMLAVQTADGNINMKQYVPPHQCPRRPVRPQLSRVVEHLEQIVEDEPEVPASAPAPAPEPVAKLAPVPKPKPEPEHEEQPQQVRTFTVVLPPPAALQRQTVEMVRYEVRYAPPSDSDSGCEYTSLNVDASPQQQQQPLALNGMALQQALLDQAKAKAGMQSSRMQDYINGKAYNLPDDTNGNAQLMV